MPTHTARPEIPRVTTQQIVHETVDILRLKQFALDNHAIVAITDARGRITYANDKFCEISGYLQPDLIGQTHRIVNSGHHPKRFFVDMWRKISSKQIWKGEICNRAKDGSLYWVDTTIVPSLDDHGDVQHYVSIRADITDRKRAEAELIQANKDLERANDEMERFLYTASHDLKSPLVTLHGFLKHVKWDLDKERHDRLPGFIDRLSSACSKLSETVDDLLNLSRVGLTEDSPEPVELRDAIQEIVNIHDLRLDERGAKLVVEGDMPTLSIDPKRLYEILDNLVSNAVKYGCDHPKPVIEIRSILQDDELLVSVRDNGQGIKPEYHSKVFGIFERLHNTNEGTGIGLAIVRKIVSQLGGHVTLESEPDEGSTFTVSLPSSLVIQAPPEDAKIG